MGMPRLKAPSKEHASVSINYIFFLLQEAATLISALVITPYVSRTLGGDGIGIYSYTQSIVSFAMLFAAQGVSLYGRREIAACGQNIRQRSIVFWDIVLLKCISTSIVIFIYAAVCYSIGEYMQLFTIQSIQVVSVALDISWLYQGENKFHINALLAIAVKTLQACCIIAFVKTRDDLALYCLVLSLFALLHNASMWIPISRVVKKVHFCEIHPLSCLKPVIALFIPQIAIQIYQVMDKTMLYVIGQSQFESGFYELSHKIINIATLLMTARSVAVQPNLSLMYANGRKKDIQAVLADTFQFIWFISMPLIVGIEVLSERFVPIYFGPGYDKVALLMRIFAPICLIIGLSNIPTAYYIASNRSKQITIAAFIGATVNLMLNAVLIPRFQSAGAAIASVVAEFVILCLWFFFSHQEISLKTVFQGAPKKIICAVLAFTPAVLLLHVKGIIGFLLAGGVGIVLYLLLLILFKDAYVQYLFCYVRKRFTY